MKLAACHLLSLCMIFFLSNKLKSQDVIRFKNNKSEKVKVIEVGPEEIKYKPFDTLVKKTFIINRKDVFTIRYEDGRIDTINRLLDKKLTGITIDEAHPYHIVRFNNKLYYQNKRLENSEVVDLAKNRAIITANDKLTQYVKRFNYHNRLFKGCVISGPILAGAGALGLIGSIYSSILEKPDANATLLQSGALIVSGISIICIASFQKIKKKKYMNLLIDVYNDTYK